METLQGRNTPQDGSSSNGPPTEDRPRGGKLSRIAGHTQGLVEDLREWIDLRIDLAILEVEETVDDLRNEVALGLTLAFFGFLTVLFGLTTLALGLGWLFGHPALGFLSVFLGLALVSLTLYKARPDLMPPSGLYEQIRGAAEEEATDDRPIRDAKASVEEQDPAPDDRS
jgi:hypothetical protein